MPSDAPLSRRALLVVVAVFAVAWFWGLDQRALLHPDEGRYAEIPREMLATGDWLSPRLNGLKYFEKPPIQYWATAIGYKIFGVHPWSARLWPVLSTFLAALFLGFVGSRLGGQTMGLYTLAALLGSVWYVLNAHLLTLDGGLTAFLGVAFGAFVLAQRDGIPAATQRNWMWLAWAAMAGATLSKGLIGVVIPGASLVLYSLVTRDFTLWRRLHIVTGTLVYLLLAAPWFVAVSRANVEFFDFFFIHEHFERYLTTSHRREGGWWYFVPLLLFGSLPWMPLLVRGAVSMWRDGGAAANGFSWQRFAVVWLAFVFLFFSASGSKLPSYILPMFPPLALLTAWLLERTPNAVMARLTLPMTVLVAVILAVAAFAYAPLVQRYVRDDAVIGPALEFKPWLVAVFASGFLGGVVALFGLRRGTEGGRIVAVLALALSVLASAQMGIVGYDAFRATRSSRDILAAAQAAGPMAADAPFYHVHMYDQTTPFYLGRTTTFVAYRDEFALGMDAEPAKAFADENKWIETWKALPQGYAMMPDDDYDRLTAAGMPMKLLARDARRVIVARR